MANTVLTGSRVALLGKPTDAYDLYECTACGRGLQGVRAVVAVPRGTLSEGYTVYSLVHDEDICIAAVT